MPLPVPPELLPVQLVRCAVIAKRRSVPWFMAVAVDVPITIVVRPVVVAMVVRNTAAIPVRMPPPATAARDLDNGRVLLCEEVGHHRPSGNRTRRGCQAESRHENIARRTHAVCLLR